MRRPVIDSLVDRLSEMRYMIVDQYIVRKGKISTMPPSSLVSLLYLRSAIKNPSAMVDIVMIVPAGPAVSEAALLPLPALLPMLLLFPAPVATVPLVPVPGKGAPVVSTLRVHRAMRLTKLQIPERVVDAALFT